MGSGFSGPGRFFVSMLSRPAAGLVCSCVLLSFPLWPGPVGLQGPSWAFPGPPLGPSWTSPGLLSGAILGFLAALRAPGPLLGRSWPLGLLVAALLVLLGRSWSLFGLHLAKTSIFSNFGFRRGSWTSPGPPWAALGSWPLGALLGALGPLLAAKDHFPRHL